MTMSRILYKKIYFLLDIYNYRNIIIYELIINNNMNTNNFPKKPLSQLSDDDFIAEAKKIIESFNAHLDEVTFFGRKGELREYIPSQHIKPINLKDLADKIKSIKDNLNIIGSATTITYDQGNDDIVVAENHKLIKQIMCDMDEYHDELYEALHPIKDELEKINEIYGDVEKFDLYI